MAHDLTKRPRWLRRAAVASLIIMAMATPAGAQAHPRSPVASDAVSVDPALQALRARMVAGKRLSFHQMRALADAGDSLAALRYAKRLEALDDPNVLVDAVHYYAMALYDGREGVISPVITLLKATSADLSPARLRVIERAIQSSSRLGNRAATEALAQMYLKGSPFGPNRDEALRLLTKLAERGDAQAALDLSLLYLNEKMPDPDTAARVQTYLTLASTSTDLSVRTMAENLMRRWPRPAMSPPARPERIIQ